MIILTFILIFVILCLAIGGDNTAKSIISLSGNALVLTAIVLAIVIGVNPLAVGIIGCILMTGISLFYQNGLNSKTLAAGAALLCVMAVMAWVGYLLIVYGNLQGFPPGQNEIRASNGYEENIGVSMVLVEAATLMIILEGALVDTALSVSSAMYEVKRHSKDIGMREFFEAGMSVGRNILNSTVNTLFFIFLGQNIVMLAYYESDFTLESFINSKALIEPLGGIILSAIGCILIIPVTTIISVRIFRNL